MSNNYNTTPKGLLPAFAWLAILSALAYAGRAVVARAGAAHLSLSHLFVLQSIISLPILAILAHYNKVSLRPKLQGNKKNYLFRIIAGICTTLFLMNALKLMPTALASTLSCTAPLFTALLAPWLLKERTTPAILVVTAIGFCGLAVAAIPYFGSLSPTAMFAGLLCGLSGAFLQIYLRKVAASGEPGIRGVFWMHAISLVLGISGCLFYQEFTFTFTEFSVCIGTAILFIIAQLSNSAAYARGRALAVNALSFLTLPLTVIFSALFLSEVVSGAVLSGMAITMPACFCVVWLEQRHLKQIHNKKSVVDAQDIREEHAQMEHSLSPMSEPLFELESSAVDRVRNRLTRVIPFVDAEFSDPVVQPEPLKTVKPVESV